MHLLADVAYSRSGGINLYTAIGHAPARRLMGFFVVLVVTSSPLYGLSSLTILSVAQAHGFVAGASLNTCLAQASACTFTELISTECGLAVPVEAFSTLMPAFLKLDAHHDRLTSVAELEYAACCIHNEATLHTYVRNFFCVRQETLLL